MSGGPLSWREAIELAARVYFETDDDTETSVEGPGGRHFLLQEWIIRAIMEASR